jgi:hypothetical protein
MEIKRIIQDENVQNILNKAGIPQNQIQIIADQAMATIKSHIAEHPTQISGLLSHDNNAKTTDAMRNEMEHAFVENLVKKVGLPENVANQVKGVLPTFINSYNKLDTKGLSEISGVTNTLKGKTPAESKKNEESGEHEEKPFSKPPKNIPQQGHTTPNDHKIGVQFHGGSQGGGSFKKSNKG